jgi:hypothetical protein
MPNSRFARLCFAALMLAAPAMSSAAVRPWLAGDIGASTYSMEDVNETVGQINAFLAGSGLSMDEVNNGLNYGLAFGLDFSNGFSAGVGYDMLTGNSKVSDASGSIEYDLPSNLLRGFGRYAFQSTGKAKGFLEASLGRVSSSASATLSVVGDPPEKDDFEGSAVAFEGGGGMSYWFSPQFAFTGSAGYRRAKIEDITVDGDPAYNASGDNYSIDYSGVFMRLGVTVALQP